MLVSNSTIQGLGPDCATIAVVSDWPSREEVFQERALVGKVGGQVDRLLKQAGSSLENVYRTSFIKIPVFEAETKNKKLRHFELSKVLAQHGLKFQEQLLNELNCIQPNVIIALGELSLNLLTNEKHIYNFRGSILPPSPALNLNFTPKIIPTLHPRDMWENMLSIAYVSVDYQKAVKLQHLKEPYVRKELIWIANTYNELHTWWHDRAKFGEFLTFDIETYLNFITCVGFCHNGVEAVSVKLWDYSSIEEQKMVWRLLNEILSSPMAKANQNVGFDRYFKEKWGFSVNNITDDTMLLGHTIYPELPKGLYFYTSIYTDQPYYKDEGKEFNPKLHSFDQLQYYNAKDALVTWQILKAQEQDARELGVWDFYRGVDYDISSLISTNGSSISSDNSNNSFDTPNNPTVKLGVMPLFHVYSKINQRGIRVDEEQRWRLLTKYNNLALIHQLNIEKTYGKEINIRSPAQVGRFVYEFLEVPKVTHKTPQGKEAYDTDKETLEDIYINSNLRENVKTTLKEIIVLRKIYTVINYIKSRTHKDGRLRTTYRLEGTESGRTSGSSHYDQEYFIDDKGKLDYFELGCSLQTLPKRGYEIEEFEGEEYGTDIPSMFVPSDGYVFVEGDGKAAEAGVVCILAKDYDTLHYMYFRKSTKENKYGCKDDIHVLTCEWTTVKPFDLITKYMRENYGKRPRHAGNYDQTEYGLSKWIHKPRKFCKEILERFHTNAPQIRAVFHKEVIDCINSSGALRSPQGRRRDFFGRRNQELYRQAFAQIPQATVSDHTKFSILILEALIPEALCLVEKHDSLLYEVPIDLEERFSLTFKKVYERPINFEQCSLSRDYELVIPAEIQVGRENWKDLKEVKL